MPTKPTYTTEQLYPWLYRIKDPLDVNFYLLTGEKKALLFDTGYGIGDIPETVNKITQNPLTVILSHGHSDHVGGAYQFSHAYLNEADTELFEKDTSYEARSEIITRLAEKNIETPLDPETWCKRGKTKLKKLIPGTVFELGGISAKAIDMAAHTAGSTGLLIPEKAILFTGDAAITHCWMFLDESSPVKDYIQMLKRVRKLNFNTFHTAHSDIECPKEYFGRFIRVARNASTEKGEPYNLRQHLNPYIYTEGDISIVINKRTQFS